MSKKLSDPIFKSFEQPLEETELFKTYKLVLIKKAKPSDGSGAIFANKEKGIEARQDLKDKTISSIFIKFYKDGRGWSAFSDNAPCGLKQENTRADVLKQLGKPAWSLEKGGIDLMAVTNSGDKWFDEIGNGLRVEYTEDDNSIKMITIQSKKLEDSFR